MSSLTPNTSSERTPLLTRIGIPADSSFDFSKIVNFAKNWDLAKIKGWSILVIDHLVFLPFVPVIIARLPFKGASSYRWEPGLGAFLVGGTIPLGIVLAFVWAFGPVLVYFVVWFLSYRALRIVESLYEVQFGRVALRTVAVATIACSLWYFVDLRQEWTPLDLPPLSNSSSSIRLLDIRPAGVRWRIEAELRTVQFEDNPAYDALSYEWGNPRKSHSISVGGKRFRVTENLWKALHNVRHETEPRTLWVDAVCIDQTSLEEKNSQVPLMSLVYQRARRVLVSLGKHVPPRWIEKSDPSTWKGSWALQTASEYWESTHYWLVQLALEEYWKRCWVVQEIGSGLTIDVYAGRQPIPWTEFAKLMRLYAEEVPSSPLPERVLRFDDLRRALYHDGETYVLAQLLDSFRDSFCSVDLDKILAFTGMAVDCRGECLPVDYAGGVKPLYEAIVSFQNSSTNQNFNGAVEMVYFSALVRRLLSRQQRKITKEYDRPGWLYQPESWAYYWCGDDAIQVCLAGPEILLFFPILEYLRAPLSASKGLSVHSSIWLSPMAEVKDIWTPDPETSPANIRVLGAIVGEVQELGPSYADYLRYPHVPQQWSARLSEKYPTGSEQSRARGLNARLTALLGPAADFRLANIVPLPGMDKPPHQQTAPGTGARLFLGGEDIIMGLAPSNARVGDKLCQFWNSSAVAILRSRDGGNDGDYDVIGRGAMLQYGDEVDWDISTNKTMFLLSSDDSVDLRFDLETLNHLSFDVVNLPGSQ